MRKLLIKYRLWVWDRNNADVLDLAERRQTVYLGHNMKSDRLQFIIRKLRAERDMVANSQIYGDGSGHACADICQKEKSDVVAWSSNA